MDFKEFETLMSLANREGVIKKGMVSLKPKNSDEIMKKTTVEYAYVGMKECYEQISRIRKLLHKEEVDTTAIDNHLCKYELILDTLEKEIYNDTKEQNIQAIELVHSYKDKILGKEEQKELLDKIRDIYERITPSPNYTKKHGLGAWLNYLQSLTENEDYFSYYYTKNKETNWCDLEIINGFEYDEEEPIEKIKSINLPF